jgi:LL-diaminopimelate aminotransferase
MIIEPAVRTHTVNEYYFAAKLRELEELKQQGKNILNLGIGSPDLMPHEEVISELGLQSRQQGSNGYQSYSGIAALREAFAGWYKKYFGIDLDPAGEILPLMGSKEGIMHISLAFLNPGDGVLIPNPGYPTYSAVSKLVGARLIEYDLKPENGWMPDLNELQAMDLSGIKLMWINYPSMPTGAKASVGFFRKLVSFAKKNRILICNDNPYSFILNDQPLSIFSAEGAKEVTIELNSLSKSHNMAAFRIGMVAGEASYLKTILNVKSNMDSGMYKPIQLAAVKALKSPPEWYESINMEYKKRRQLAGGIFDELGVKFDDCQSGMFLWGRIPEEFPGAICFSDLILANYLLFITPGDIFGSNGKNHIRISLCSSQDVFREALDRIGINNKQLNQPAT